MTEKVKTLEELKKDKVNFDAQFEQLRNQLSMTVGIRLYLEQEIAKLEKPVEEAK